MSWILFPFQIGRTLIGNIGMSYLELLSTRVHIDLARTPGHFHCHLHEIDLQSIGERIIIMKYFVTAIALL